MLPGYQSTHVDVLDMDREQYNIDFAAEEHCMLSTQNVKLVGHRLKDCIEAVTMNTLFHF